MSATTANDAGAVMAKAMQSPARLAVRRFFRRPAAVGGLVVITLFIIVALAAPWVAPFDPTQTSWTLIRKAPSADLWPGQTDEDEAGFSYPELDRLLFWRIDKRRTEEEIVALGFDPALVARVDRLVAGAEFKRQVPPIAKLGPRTAGVDYLYPRRRPGSKRA